MRGIFKKVKANIDGTAVKVKPRDMFRLAVWLADEGWRPTGTVCADDGNLVYSRGDERACSGQLIARWKASNQDSAPASEPRENA